MRRLILFLLLLITSPCYAVSLYVDALCTNNITIYQPGASGAARCTGGADRSFSTIANSFAYSSLAAGDHIKIRSGTYAENATLSGKPGTNGNNIVIEPYAAETATITSAGAGGTGAAISITNSSYVTVQNLTFDGTGRNCPISAIKILASTADSVGNVITGNTITHWGFTTPQDGMRPIFLAGTSATAWIVSTFTISNNVIVSSATENMRIVSAYDGTIDGNDISSPVCFTTPGNPQLAQIGIKMAGNSAATGLALASSRITVSNNTIHDFQNQSTCNPADPTVVNSRAIYGDVGATFVTVKGNTIYKISPGSSAANNVAGIEVESRCDDWVVQENRIYSIGGSAIQVGSSTHRADRLQIINNAIFSTTRYGINFRCGANSVISNNAIDDAATAQILVEAGAIASNGSCPSWGGHAINYNDYWDLAGGNKVGNWNGAGVLTFANWKTNSGQDTNGKNANPLFVSTTPGSEDFHLQAGSTLISAGSGGLDMGAFPASAPPPVSISVVYPNGGEAFLPGDVVAITWIANDTGNFKLELTKDNGTTYETIVASTANDTSYNWTVTAGASSNCKVRVSSVGTPASLDTSDAIFRTRGFYTGALP